MNVLWITSSTTLTTSNKIDPDSGMGLSKETGEPRYNSDFSGGFVSK